MPAKPRHKRRSGQPPTLATSLEPLSGFAASTDDDAENGTPDEAAYDEVTSESDLRDAGDLGEAASPPCLSAEAVAQLHQQIELLQGRLDTARFDHRGGTSHGHDLGRLLVWKHQSFRGLPSDTPLCPSHGQARVSARSASCSF